MRDFDRPKLPALREMSPAKAAIEVFAWIGVTVILIAYALLSFDVIESDSITFQLSNLIGAAGIASISFLRQVFQPLVLNTTWAVIALVAIIRIAL